ncbi:hypothetical protein AB0912_22105 [Streptomyces sp. NPDC007084]|uniref:hypothetical protein n=1 Tax=Streptomyces sp. NPDC007084 TaxID=3154313 RepID=UPI003455B7A9
MGATRVLRPAVATLVERGERVLAVSRTAADLELLGAECPGWVRTLAADCARPDFPSRLRRAVEPAGLSGALVYAPAASPHPTTRVPAGLLGGKPLVLILTSEVAAPKGRDDEEAAFGRGEPPHGLVPPEALQGVDVRPLVLGWCASGGAVRWHTPAEISAAALALLDARHSTGGLLGTVRPWADRPR